MRDLKFRIWNGFQFVTKSDTYIKTCDGSLWDYDYDGNLWSAEAKIQQYTGVKDKNNADIYEGDIVKVEVDGKVFYREVEYDCGAYIINLNDTVGAYAWTPLVSSFDDEIEVVGNSFEKPDLLTIPDDNAQKKYTVAMTCSGGTAIAGEYKAKSEKGALKAAKLEHGDEWTYYIF